MDDAKRKVRVLPDTGEILLIELLIQYKDHSGCSVDSADPHLSCGDIRA